MSQHFLAPFVAQVGSAMDHYQDHDGATTAHAVACVTEGLRFLCLYDSDITTILAACREIQRAAARGHRLGAQRALDIVTAGPDPLTRAAVFETVGHGDGRSEPALMILRSPVGEDGEPQPAQWQTCPDGFRARMHLMAMARPSGSWQPGWSQERLMREARRSARRLP